MEAWDAICKKCLTGLEHEAASWEIVAVLKLICRLHGVTPLPAKKAECDAAVTELLVKRPAPSASECTSDDEADLAEFVGNADECDDE